MDDDQLDHDLKATFRRALARDAEPAAPTTPDPVDGVRSRVAVRDRRRRGTTAAAAAATIALMVGGMSFSALRDDDATRLEIQGPATSPTRVSVPRVSTGTNPPATPAPPSPDPRFDQPTPPTVAPADGPGLRPYVSMARSVFDEADGVGVLPAPPLEVRGDVAEVWTGSELVLWGGDVEAFNMGLPGGDRSYDDGAVYSPASGAWRPMSPSPLPATAETPAAVMTPDGVLFVRGTAAALWEPTTDAWRSVPDAPAPVSRLVQMGDLSVSTEAAAAFDARTTAWRAIAPPPSALERATAASTGAELVVLGGPGTPFTSAAAAAYDPVTDSWRELPGLPPELHAEALSATWDGRRVVVVNYDMQAVAYDPATDRWDRLPNVPARFSEWIPATRHAGGVTATVMAGALVLLRGDDRWLPVPKPTSVGGAVLAAGDALVAVGIGRDSRTLEITVIDPARIVAAPSRVQVGIASVGLAPDDQVTEATFDPGEPTGPIPPTETVRLGLRRGDGTACTLRSSYAFPNPGPDLTVAEHRPTLAFSEWVRDDADTTWQTASGGTDRLTVACDRPGEARLLVDSVAG